MMLLKKLRPFFPPLETLQSLNLRTALFRCLEHAKKDGILGRDSVLRKSMLDDCKGERLEEILAVFSNAVLKNVIQTAGESSASPIAQRLALENFSYAGERAVLSALILAHKVSLHSQLQEKEDANARYHDFADLLNLVDRRITRRHEQLKLASKERGPPDALSSRDIRALQDEVEKNWSGREEWLESILYGDTRVRRGGLLAAKFDSVWRHVEDGSIGDVEENKQIGLLEQLDARVRSQEARLARWRDFGKTLSKSGGPSPSKKKVSAALEGKRIDLGFNLHQGLQINRSNTSETVEATSHASLKEYTHLIESMKVKLANVEEAPAVEVAKESPFPDHRSSIAAEKDEPTANDEWSSASDTDEAPGGATSYTKESSSTQEMDPSRGYLENQSTTTSQGQRAGVAVALDNHPPETVQKYGRGAGPSKYPLSRTPPPIPVPEHSQSIDSESDLAGQILNSVSTSSPSPKKARHTLSLAERTRLSMSRASHSQYSDLHDDIDNLADLPRLSAKPRPQPPESSSSEGDKHADLIQRTRQSMAGFEAAQKRAQIERRRSVKDAKKQQRESRHFPTLDEEHSPGQIDPAQLIEGDPDYESVFKSRPKIKTSPAVSPTRSWE
jgi:hypothetical protein